MINLKTFATFLLEAVKLTPKELKKRATGGPNEGMLRLDILAKIVNDRDPLELEKGGSIVAANVSDVLASIEQFKKDGKAFEIKATDGKAYSSSDLGKSKAFGGGAGAGGGTTQTAIGEAAQCVWIAATLGEGYDKPADYFTDEILTKYFKRVSVGKTKLKEILEIDDSWRKSSHITSQFAVKNALVDSDMTFHRDDDVMKGIYKAKNTAFKNNDFKPLMDDKWNPGDIWAVEDGFSIKELDTSTVESLNDDILDLHLQKRLVGISLKKVSSAVQSVEKNVERPPQTADYKFLSGHIKALVRGEWYTTKANYITFAGGQVDIRANSAFGSHKSEIKGKKARGGGASWGVMQDASARIYGKSKELPKNTVLKKESQAIAKGDKKAIAKFTKMLQVHDNSILDSNVIKELNNKKRDAAVWIHGKLGGLYVLDLLQKGGKKANQFITQLVNYAGSATSDSSAYIILKEK